MTELIWTPSMNLAAPFMSGFVVRGIAPTEALTIYRRAGGAIRRGDWFSAYEVVTALEGHVETIKGMRANAIVRKEKFEQLGRDYSEPLVMRAEYEATNVLTGERETRYATALSEHEMTRRDWEEELEAAVVRTEESPTMRDFSWLTLAPEWSTRFGYAETSVR